MSLPALPRSAFILGFLGLVPALLALGGAILLPDPDLRLMALRAGALYSAIILSFLGGTWWAFATRAPAERQLPLLVLSVLPSLLAWGCVLMTNVWTLLALGAIIILTPATDRLLEMTGLAPAGWMRLRLPLSLGLGVLTSAMGLAAAWTLAR